MGSNIRRAVISLAVTLAAAALLAGCASDNTAVVPRAEPASQETLPVLEAVPLEAGQKLQVVASTSIVGDVVAQVGGEWIDLFTLMAAGQDPHSYEPVARDLARVEEADVLFVNGLGLEGSLLKVLETAGGRVPLVPVSAGIVPLALADGYEGEEEHTNGDPHTWMDPTNVVVWADNIASALAALDPAHAETYHANATAYTAELRALDADIQAQVGRIPPDQRKLVTNHESFGYFARRYGFEVVGTVYIGAGQLAEPSAGDMAKLIDTIKAEGVHAIFVETTVSPELARVLADEVGYEVSVYSLYTGALGEPGSGADSYLGMMRANIETIVEGLAAD